MSLDAFLALFAYAFVTSVTPGPNNFMLLASGVNFGFVRTVPHMLGISAGFLSLLLGVGFGLGALLTAFPSLHLALKVAGGAYLLYLAWRIAMSRSLGKAGDSKCEADDVPRGGGLPVGKPKSLGHGGDGNGRLHQPASSVPVGDPHRRGFHAGQPAECFGLGRLRHGAARISCRSRAAEVVQHHDGRGARGHALADAALIACAPRGWGVILRMAHDHHHDNELDPMAARVRALETILTQKGLIDPAAIDVIVETYEKKVGPRNGAKVVAKAWSDPAFADWLKRDATAAIASLGFSGRQGEHMQAVFNTPDTHNLVVCTLCSCYPWSVLGLPPVWYKAPPYRSRAVIDPRGVLEEFGLTLPAETKIRVWDSTAELRYLVVPMRPAGTEGFSEEQLADLVTRDAMIGTGLALEPETA